MPFIGNQPALSYTSFAKQDFTTSATTSYTLDHPVTNENEIALFINFVRQEPTTAYTASGTSLTLTSATSATDDMYCVFLGKAVQTVNPPAGSVGASQIADSSIALGKLSATGTKDATTFLRGDNTFNTPPLGGITQADMFRLSASVSGDLTPISSNIERVDNATFSKIGTGMSVSSGVFSFPSTGLYFIQFNAMFFFNGAADSNVNALITGTANDSSYDDLASAECGGDQGDNKKKEATTQTYFNCTNVSTHKVRFRTASMNSNTLLGSTDINKTIFTFIRLGDSQ